MEKEEIINNIPKKLRIDICNLCQLDCPECWIRKNEDIIKEKYGGFGYVNFETFKNFIDNNPFIEEIEISNNGEIFLNPDLLEIIIYAHQKNIILTAGNGVNLNYLPDNIAEALVKYKFESLFISIDGASQETYSIYRRKGDFNKVIDNIKLINKYKKKYNSEFPYLLYKFIVFGHNEHEIEKAKEIAKELNIDIGFVVNSVDGYSPVKDPERVKKLTGITNTSNQLIQQYEIYRKNNGWFYCLDLYKKPQINWNGELMGCCAVLDGFKINVFEEGLEKALNSEKIWYAKQMLLDYNIQPREDIPCSTCNVYKFLRDNKLQLF